MKQLPSILSWFHALTTDEPDSEIGRALSTPFDRAEHIPYKNYPNRYPHVHSSICPSLASRAVPWNRDCTYSIPKPEAPQHVMINPL